MGEKVLVVEDGTALREVLERSLIQQGCGICRVPDGRSALDAARQEHPDLVVLDRELAVLDGLDVCRDLRQEMTAPILLVAAGTAEEDRVAGLEAGADDYLPRPFSVREFLVRIRALLRRAALARAERDRMASHAAQPPAQPPHPDDLAIDAARREVRRNGRVLHLKPREYKLLLFLFRNPGVAHSREALLKAVWGWDRTGSTRTVDVHVCWLRDKIEPDSSRPRRIVTVRGFGYRFEG